MKEPPGHVSSMGWSAFVYKYKPLIIYQDEEWIIVYRRRSGSFLMCVTCEFTMSSALQCCSGCNKVVPKKIRTLMRLIR